jgi:transposase
MEHYVGLDVSLKLTAICIVDRTGKIEREGVVSSDPEAIAIFIKSHAPHVVRVGLETGATATWLWTELNKLGLPVICIDARHAKAALKMQINKSDRNDAVGIARIMQCGWYKEVHVKDLDSHAVKALLVSRALLVKIKRDLENQIRGLLKNLGLVIGRAKMNVFAVRAAGASAGARGCGSTATQRSRCHRAADRGFGPEGDAAGPQKCSSTTIHDGTRCWANHGSLLPRNDR